ncbi:Uncharacterized protein FKW44_024198, partial [Caligus rogercresseyi]
AYKEEGVARKVRDTDFVDKVMKMVEDDPTRSMRTMSRDLGCHEKTIRDCLSEDLRCRIYEMQKAKGQRLMKSTKLLNKLSSRSQGRCGFSLMKQFSQNNRWIATCTNHVRKVMKTKFPATVMVMLCLPTCFETGLKVNTEVYLDVMEKQALGVAAGLSTLPCVQYSMQWLTENCYDVVTKDLWPPNSPDLRTILSGT